MVAADGGATGRIFRCDFTTTGPGTPVGPASGPQSQMAQNIVLSWLAGSRIMELKTVQVNDELAIGRPCIDAANMGYNIEWSQELAVADSLDQYVQGAMLIHMLRHGAGSVRPTVRRRGSQPAAAARRFTTCRSATTWRASDRTKFVDFIAA